MRPQIALVLGGARSGKSDFAEGLLSRLCKRRLYVATAQAKDAEMADRIAQHRKARGNGWRTLEAPLDPLAALGELEQGEGALLDCLTLWLSNHMLAEANIDTESSALLGGLQKLTHPVVLVSNEVGMGLVPENKLGRAFRDAQGRLNQQAAEIADLVVFVAAGLPLVLKGELP